MQEVLGFQMLFDSLHRLQNHCCASWTVKEQCRLQHSRACLIRMKHHIRPLLIHLFSRVVGRSRVLGLAIDVKCQVSVVGSARYMVPSLIRFGRTLFITSY